MLQRAKSSGLDENGGLLSFDAHKLALVTMPRHTRLVNARRHITPLLDAPICLGKLEKE